MLSDNQFSGPLPHSLAKSSFLLHLNLSENQLSGSPDFAGALWPLSRLRALNLSSNQFSSPVTNGIANLHNLKAINLSGNRKPAAGETVLSPAELELSWVVLDPARGRAVNVSSRRAVAVDRHWYTGETLVPFAVVLGGCKFESTVTCSEGTGHVSEVFLAV
ncbi:hypothetical protein ABZP36_031836 [Zizania latifolia]